MVNKGLKIDGSNIAKPDGCWVKAKNCIYNSVNDAIQAEYGLTGVTTTLVGEIIGFEVTPKGIIIFAVDLDTVGIETSKVYLFNGTLVYSVISDSTGILGFKQAFPIVSSESYINSNNEIVCTFSDKQTSAGNRSKIIVCTSTGVLQNDLSINGISRFPSPKLPTLAGGVDNNGSLLSGAYQFTIQYENKIGVRSNWFIPTRPIYVAHGDDYFAEYEGLPQNAISNQSLVLYIDNLDSDFTKLRIGVVYKNGATTRFQLAAELVIVPTLTNMTFNLINNDQVLEDLNIIELTAKLPAFVNIGTETQLDKKSYIADLSTFDDNDKAVQQVATSIIIHSTVTWDELGTGSKHPDWMGFQSREVYAFYLHMIRPDWTITKGFHIPGRRYKAGVDDKTTEDIHGSGNHYPKEGFAFRYYSTNPYDDSTNTAPVYVNDTVNNAGNPPTAVSLPYGHMDYWENEDEFYPESGSYYPALGTSLNNNGTGAAVRHHKFPSIDEIKKWADSYYIANPGDLTNDTGAATIEGLCVTHFPRLGFITQSDIDFTGVQDKYIGAIITYAERNGNNSLIIGQDIWHQCAKASAGAGGGTGIYNSTGNWNIHQFPSGTITFDKEEDYIRLHSYSLLKNKLYIAANIFTSLECKYTLEDMDIGSAGSPSQSGFFNTGDINKYAALCNYSHVNSVASISPTLSDCTIDLTSVEYVPHNINKTYDGTTIENQYGEEFVIAKVNDATGLINKPIVDWLTSRATSKASVEIADGEDWSAGDPHLVYSYLHTLQRYYNNVYLSFTNQRLVITSPGSGTTAITIATDTRFGSSDITTVYPVLNGDTFAGRNCIISTSCAIDLLGVKVIPPTGFDGIKAIHLYPCESRFNLNLRYESSYVSSDGTNNSLYLPKTGYDTDPEFVWLLTEKHTWGSPYEFCQDVMYDSINNIESLSCSNIYDKSFNTYPVRIARSLPYNSDTIDSSNWSKFPIADYYDHIADYDTIWVLMAYKDRLIIHHKKGLFLSRSIGRLQADGSIDVTITSGDMFDIAPTAIVTSDGDYAGCQSKWGAILTEFGYFFIDASKGRIYKLSDEGLQEISRDNKEHFERYFKLTNNYDNPFYTQSNYHHAILGYDSEFKRILVSGNQGLVTNICGTLGLVFTFEQTIGTYDEGDNVCINITTIAPITTIISIYSVTVGGGTILIGIIPISAINKRISLYKTLTHSGTILRYTCSANFNLAFVTYLYASANLFFKSRTISYMPENKQWMAEHNYIPRMLASYNDVLYSSPCFGANINTNNTRLFSHNIATALKGIYYDETYVYAWYIDVLYNVEARLSKVLQSIDWQTIVIPINIDVPTNNVYDKTFSHIAVYNDNQASGDVELINANYYVNSNHRHRVGTWTTNRFRDLVINKRAVFMDNSGNFITSNLTNNKSYFEKSKFISKFVVVRLKDDNLLEIDGNYYEVILTDINVNARLV